jgi:hypothetical protein
MEMSGQHLIYTFHSPIHHSSNHSTIAQSVVDMLTEYERYWPMNHSTTTGLPFHEARVMKSFILRSITPCCPLKVHWRFGGKYRLLLQAWNPIHTLFPIHFMLYLYSVYSSNLETECLYTYIHFIPNPLLRNGSVSEFSRQGICVRSEELFTSSFSMQSASYHRKRTVSSSQRFLSAY